MSRKRFYQVSILVMVTASLLIGFLMDRQKAILACDQDYGLQPPDPLQPSKQNLLRTVGPEARRKTEIYGGPRMQEGSFGL